MSIASSLTDPVQGYRLQVRLAASRHQPSYVHADYLAHGRVHGQRRLLGTHRNYRILIAYQWDDEAIHLAVRLWAAHAALYSMSTLGKSARHSALPRTDVVRTTVVVDHAGR